MKIVDAFWEERNLGVTCYELEMELADRVDAVAAALEGLEERQYMVAKIPSSRYDLAQLYQKRGYSFIETSIALETDYRKMNYQPPDIPKRLQKICGRCSWNIMDKTDLIQLSNEIKKNIFKTDRVFIDPEFTHEQAARRYDLWIKDLIQQGNTPYKVMLDYEVIGFFLNKEIAPHIYHGVLGGIYADYEGTGLGYLYDYAGFMSSLERRAEKSITSVSTNNPKILKLHLAFGSTIKGFTNVFVKHSK